MLEKLTGFPMVSEPADERICDRVVRVLAGKSRCVPAAPVSLLVVDCASCARQFTPSPDQDESYTLSVNSSQVFLRCQGNAGLVRGLDSFLQLLRPTRHSQGAVRWQVYLIYAGSCVVVE